MLCGRLSPSQQIIVFLAASVSSAGSILDMRPATTYEMGLEMRDRDGVRGEAVSVLTLTTRAAV